MVTKNFASFNSNTNNIIYPGHYAGGLVNICINNNGGSAGGTGANGKSAYDLAVENGFQGTVTEWLASLKGENGQNGASSYEIAVKNGFEGTEQEWLDSLDDNIEAKTDKIEGSIEVEMPYRSDGSFYACGFPVYIEKNTGHKYDAALSEDAIIASYYCSNQLQYVELESTDKVYGGYGINNIDTKRTLTNTKISAKGVTLDTICGGNYGNGIVGDAEIVIDNCNVNYVYGGGYGEGSTKHQNMVYNASIKATNLTGASLYGGGYGYSLTDESAVEINGASHINYVTAGGADGYTGTSSVTINDGAYSVVQSASRGVVNSASLEFNGGTITNLYYGAETSDDTATGIINDAELKLNYGTVDTLAYGTSNGQELNAVKGTIFKTVVNNGPYDELTVVTEANIPSVDGNITIDRALDADSSNALANSVIANELEKKAAKGDSLEDYGITDALSEDDTFILSPNN